MSGQEIYVEFIQNGNFVKATAIDGESGMEASIVGPANAPRNYLADAATKKLKYVMEKEQKSKP